MQGGRISPCMNNSNTNSAIQILTSAEARNRLVRWELIKTRNAHYVWHPRCIDAALNSTYDGSSWGGRCGTAARKAGLYEIYTECYKSIQELALILYRQDTSLRDLFLRTNAASVQHVIPQPRFDDHNDSVVFSLGFENHRGHSHGSHGVRLAVFLFTTS